MKSVICIASGPSLTNSDCKLAIASDYPVIAVNSSICLIPDCNYLFAADCGYAFINIFRIEEDQKGITAYNRRCRF